jgi:hypothetical protein
VPSGARNGKEEMTMTEKPFNVVKRDDLVPLCPHCGKELTEVYMKTKGLGFIEAHNVLYFCPHCLKVLGFGQSRMM